MLHYEKSACCIWWFPKRDSGIYRRHHIAAEHTKFSSDWNPELTSTITSIRCAAQISPLSSYWQFTWADVFDKLSIVISCGSQSLAEPSLSVDWNETRCFFFFSCPYQTCRCHVWNEVPGQTFCLVTRGWNVASKRKVFMVGRVAAPQRDMATRKFDNIVCIVSKISQFTSPIKLCSTHAGQ